jgi:hypothetical protein
VLAILCAALTACGGGYESDDGGTLRLTNGDSEELFEIEIEQPGGPTDTISLDLEPGDSEAIGLEPGSYEGKAFWKGGRSDAFWFEIDEDFTTLRLLPD